VTGDWLFKNLFIKFLSVNFNIIPFFLVKLVFLSRKKHNIMAKAKNKTTENNLSVDDFLNSVENEKRREDSQKVLKLMWETTGEDPKMWGKSIVGFGTYHYKYASGREGDFMKVGFSPRKTALTLYIMDGFDRHEELMQQLGKYKTGKSCLYIKKLEDIDLEVLKDLVNESVAYISEKYPEAE